MYNYGKVPQQGTVVTYCGAPYLYTIHQFDGMMESYHYDATNGYNVLRMGSDGQHGIIDADGLVGTNGDNSALLLNYYCGNDIIAGNGTSGDLKAAHNFFVTGTSKFTGNVGIGTIPATISSIKLHTQGFLMLDGPEASMMLGNDNSSTAYGEFGLEYFDHAPNASLQGLNIWKPYQSTYLGAKNFLLYICNRGNTLLGGLPNPTDDLNILNILSDNRFKLSVNGGLRLFKHDDSNSNKDLNSFQILSEAEIPYRRGISINDDPSGNFNLFINSNQGSAQFNFKDGAFPNDPNLMTIRSFGGNGVKVGIGVSNSTNWSGDYKLYVASGIRTEKVKVDLSDNTHGGWGDFVFDQDYQLKDLDEVESFIKTKKHLPGIPNAKEVKEGGIDVAEMLAKQMVKIEELTLYVIQLKNENKELRNLILTSK